MGMPISYLDVGDTYFRGDWAAAINGYWSPLYSWCLGLALYVLKPSIWWEFITVHLVIYYLHRGTIFFSFLFYIPCCAQSGERASHRMTQFLARVDCVGVGIRNLSLGFRWC